MLTRYTTLARSGIGLEKIVVSTVPVAALALVAACGSADPQVNDTPTSTEAGSGEGAPMTTEPQETSADATSTTESATDTATDSTTEDPTSESAAESSDPPQEEPADPATEGLAVVREYADLVTTGATDEAYSMLSPEAMVYFPALSVFEENGVADLADDLSSASVEPQWAVRPAYEETHDSAKVVSVWGENADGTPFAHSWAVRKLDGSSWVIDQDITPSTGRPRLTWFNPSPKNGAQWWEVNMEIPISFALRKKVGPNVAVTVSIDDGSETSQQLIDFPTDAAVGYDLSDSMLGEGLHVVTASWVAEDDPFVHTGAAPAANPADG